MPAWAELGGLTLHSAATTIPEIQQRPKSFAGNNLLQRAKAAL